MNTISIPVPSRLYTKYLANPRPLEGVRVAVKDLYDVAGVPSGLGNRAYWLTYEPRNATAVSIQRLIDQVSDVPRASKSVYR
jgi:Asp-tRNA(Asn)/Glu-tRNA(Gln) amidotransferase A subunit family amidase